jgi:hypothetical protein
LHTGFGAHVVVSEEKEKKKKRKRREKIKNISFALFGLLTGFLLGGF